MAIEPADRTACLSHTELGDPSAMVADCLEAQRALGLPSRSISLTAPSLLYVDQPTDLPKREISVPAAAARLSAAYFGD